jgi:hypothetical protein
MNMPVHDEIAPLDGMGRHRPGIGRVERDIMVREPGEPVGLRKGSLHCPRDRLPVRSHSDPEVLISDPQGHHGA